jgi:hypothetical protein
VPEKNDFNLWDKAKQGAGFIWKEHPTFRFLRWRVEWLNQRADQLNQDLNPFYVKPANALREIACTIKPWWDNHFPNTINETPLITNFHFCQTLTKVTDIAPRRKNISYAHQTGKPQQCNYSTPKRSASTKSKIRRFPELEISYPNEQIWKKIKK